MNDRAKDAGIAAAIGRHLRTAVIAFGCMALAPLSAAAQKQSSASPCPRPAAGSIVTPHADLFSSNGSLSFGFDYFTTVDADGRTLFCFVTADKNAFESPTLRVKPGDTLMIAVTNRNPPGTPRRPCQIRRTDAAIKR